MALKVSLTEFEECDKCGVRGTQESPVMIISGSYKRQREVIFAHERCLVKAIDLAKKTRDKELAGAKR